jgi:hypothetical protein
LVTSACGAVPLGIPLRAATVGPRRSAPAGSRRPEGVPLSDTAWSVRLAAKSLAWALQGASGIAASRRSRRIGRSWARARSGRGRKGRPAQSWRWRLPHCAGPAAIPVPANEGRPRQAQDARANTGAGLLKRSPGHSSESRGAASVGSIRRGALALVPLRQRSPERSRSRSA